MKPRYRVKAIIEDNRIVGYKTKRIEDNKPCACQAGQCVLNERNFFSLIDGFCIKHY